MEETSEAADIIEIVLNKGNHGLGFNIIGGKDTPHLKGDSGIFIAKIRDQGAAASTGILQEGDRLISVNGNSLENVSHQEAVLFFQNAGSEVKLKVEQGAEAKVREQQLREYKVGRMQHTATQLSFNNPIILLTSLAAVGTALFLGYRYMKSSS